MDTTSIAAALMSMSASSTQQSVQTSIIKQQLDAEKQAVAILDPGTSLAANPPGVGTLVDKLA